MLQPSGNNPHRILASQTALLTSSRSCGEGILSETIVQDILRIPNLRDMLINAVGHNSSAFNGRRHLETSGKSKGHFR
jgi:hypothetical protein